MALASAAVIVAIGSFAARSLRRPVVSGSEEMLGALGVVERATDDGDWWIAVHGEHWRARSAQALVPGDRVRVARIDGLTLTVTPIAAHSDAAASAPGPESAAPDTRHLPRSTHHDRPSIRALAPRWSVFLVVASIKILREYRRGVIFLLGRFWKVKGPGLVIVIPGIQQMVKVDLRVVTMDVPRRTSSRATTSRSRSMRSCSFASSIRKRPSSRSRTFSATSQLAQTTLRAVLGKHEARRDARRARTPQPRRTADPRRADRLLGHPRWPTSRSSIDLNESMVRAIARQAEAERERRAKVIHAEGESRPHGRCSKRRRCCLGSRRRCSCATLQTLTQVAGDKARRWCFRCRWICWAS